MRDENERQLYLVERLRELIEWMRVGWHGVVLRRKLSIYTNYIMLVCQAPARRQAASARFAATRLGPVDWPAAGIGAVRISERQRIRDAFGALVFHAGLLGSPCETAP
jgi:hypothetical protein